MTQMKKNHKKQKEKDQGSRKTYQKMERKIPRCTPNFEKKKM
jgi:ribosomal protein S15P/S13E